MRSCRPDRGETLIEVLIAIAIIGITAAALFGGISAGIFSSTIHRHQTIAGTILESAGETLANISFNPYVNCATTGSYNPEGGFTNEVPSGGWSVSITQVEWWSGSSFIPSTSPNCPDTTSDGFLHLQLIDISVYGPGGQTIQSRSYIKRGP